MKKTYTVPLLSVLTVQPWRPPLLLPLFTAAVSDFGPDQVEPPSVERVNTTGSGAARPFSCPRKETLQR